MEQLYNLSDMTDELINYNMSKEIVKQNKNVSCFLSEDFGNINRTYIELKENNEYHKAKGIYITYDSNKLFCNKRETRYLINKLKKDLKAFVGESKNILCIGVGNSYVVSDSLGPLTIEAIVPIVTSKNNLCKFSPSVIGNTGIDSHVIINSLINAIKPDKVIVIDSLCSRRFNRIGTSIQLSNVGIVPGSGVGSGKFALTKENLGVDVIAIGVPTVVYLKSIFMELEISRANLEFLNGVFVSPKEIDVLVKNSANIISSAINMIY